jgi:catechol 2,3-dioxygenase-like lactoylglutathione lyase family enzyme
MKRASVGLALLLGCVALVLIASRSANAHNPDPNDPLQSAMPVLKVADIDKAVTYYTDVLGFHEEFKAADPSKPANYAGVGRGMVNFHLSTGKNAIEGGSIYILVKDVDKLHEQFKSKGANITEPPADRPYQMRDFVLKTPDGHTLSFGQGIEKK